MDFFDNHPINICSRIQDAQNVQILFLIEKGLPKMNYLKDLIKYMTINIVMLLMTIRAEKIV